VAPRTYVVTGSASGIGRATSERLETEGHRIIGVDLHDADVVADLARPDGRERLVSEVEGLVGGSLEGVIACAGVGGSADPELVVALNFFGAVATLEGLRPLLARGDNPRAVAVSSRALLHEVDEPALDACLAGDEPAALAAVAERGRAYPTAKRALARWVRRVATTQDWAGEGIPINAVAPGMTETPMTRDLLDDAARLAELEAGAPQPLKRLAAPGEVAAAIAWLAGPENTLATGQVLFVDGGAEPGLRGDDIW
jgi:NAD(P)-dependent dehydrogenase (short-subunit alcohol dehydrogenase family)